MIPLSREMKEIYAEARDIARQAGKPFISAHLLFGIYTINCRAKNLLKEKKIDWDTLLSALPGCEKEAPETVEIIYRKASEISQHIGSSQITSLHMLMAVSRITSSSACRLLEKVGISPANLRTMSLNALMNPKPNSITKMKAVAESVDHAVTFSGNSVVTTETIDDEEEEEKEEGIRRSQAIGESPAAEMDFPGEQSGRLSRFFLDPDEFPLLNSLGRNLTMQAEQGLLDPVIGREKEITLIMDILNKRRSNNPCLIGEAGVGKTAIVEGLALEIAKGNVNEGLRDKIIVSISVSDLVAGTHLRGSFAERLSGLKEEVKRAAGRILIFIDEIHTLISAGTGDGALDAAQDLKASLARGEFPCIGATTTKEYRKYIESDPALERRFQPVIVNEPSREETIAIIKGLLEFYSDFHGVEYSEEAINAAVNLSTRYITDRCQPDKAVALIDSAGGRVKRERRNLVSAEDVAHVVSMMTDIPLERLILKDSEHLLKMEDFFSKRIVGHGQCIKKICEVIRRNHAGFRDRKPLGSFLLIGAPGSGKTEIVRVLADFLFGSREAVLRINMSEYSEKHSISRLIGPPPGYVGFEEGGLLSDSLFKRPYQIVLFSDIEYASQDVLNLLLQIFDEGRIFDSKGKKIDFRNTIIVLTTSIGQAILLEQRTKGIGFDFVQTAGDEDNKGREAIEKRVIEEAARRISSELLNRIEEKVVFHPLTMEEIRKVASLLIQESAAKIYFERGCKLTVDEAVIDFLIRNGGYTKDSGARGMRHAVKRHIESSVADFILSNRSEIERIHVSLDDDKIAVAKG